MVRTVVALCGEQNSGKSHTLRRLFRLRGLPATGSIRIGKRIVCVRGVSSPQEQEEFCQYRDVQDNIKERTDYCDGEFGKSYTLVIPFTIQKKGRKTNERCIVKPIKWLKKRGFRVFIIYLRKLNYADIMMGKITKNEIKSDENYRRQARELKRFIRRN